MMNTERHLPCKNPVVALCERRGGRVYVGNKPAMDHRFSKRGTFAGSSPKKIAGRFSVSIQKAHMKSLALGLFFISASIAVHGGALSGTFLRDIAADILKGVLVDGIDKALRDAVTAGASLPVEKRPVLDLTWQIPKLSLNYYSAKIVDGRTSEWGEGSAGDQCDHVSRKKNADIQNLELQP